MLPLSMVHKVLWRFWREAILVCNVPKDILSSNNVIYLFVRVVVVVVAVVAVEKIYLKSTLEI